MLQGFISPVVALWLPRKTHPIHGPDCFTSRPNDKNKNFPRNHSLACANYAIYAAIHACIVYVRKAEKIGKVMMRRVENKYRKQNP